MTGSAPFSDMPERLWGAAASAARFTLSNFTTEDDAVALRTAMSLGLAVEQLLMSSVAQADPALLAARTSVPSMVALSRSNSSGVLHARKLRTIGWRDAHDILRQMEPTLALLKDIEFVMDTRNGAAHLAMVERSDLQESAGRLVHIVDTLHASFLGFAVDDFWGASHTSAVVELRYERENRVNINYQTKLLAARERLRVTLSAIEVAQRPAVIAVLETRGDRFSVSTGTSIGEGTSREECPACGHQAYVHYALELNDDFDEEVDVNRYGEIEGAGVTASVEWIPLVLECPVCDLQLEGDDVDLVPNVAQFTAEERHLLDSDELARFYGY